MGVTTPNQEQLVGWTPIRLQWTDAEPVVDWCYTQGERFDDPFFDQSVTRCLQRPVRMLFRRQTPMAMLGQVAEAGDTLPLAGLVFHSSRCGSTLVSQMLAQLSSTLVMAEPGPVQSVLEAPSTDSAFSDDQVVDWLRWMVAVLGQRRRPEQRHLVIKLDAWAVLYQPLLVRAFPETPRIFLYRDPIEVLVSQMSHPGYHMIPGCLPPFLLGLDPADLTRLAPEDYMACVLGALLEAAASSNGSMLVAYPELPDAVTRRIAPWFGVEIETDELGRLEHTAGRHAKNPAIPFAADSVVKQGQATDALRAAVERWVRPHYEALEAYRAGQT